MVLGIDLGTTYSAAAYIDSEGEPQVIINTEGDRITPSVFFEENKENIIIGEVAKDNAIIRPQDVVAVVKNHMGTKETFTMSSGRTYVPEQISSFIIRKMVQDAEAYTGERITDVAITVPAYFTDAQRKATEDAAKIAGVNMRGSINEPTAAMLCYIHKNKIEKGKVMIYDLGGGTFDVSVVSVEGNDIKVLSTDGICHAGGHFFDQEIVSYVCDYMREKDDIDLENEDYLEELQDLYIKAEKAKIQLSSRDRVMIPIKIGKVKESIEITRDFFQTRIKRVYRNTETKMKNALKNAGITVDELDTVLLVGGCSRIPFIVESVHRFTGKEPAKDINPDEAVAIGAAIFGEMQEKEDTTHFFQDTTSHSIGFVYVNQETRKLENHILIPKNTSLPAEAVQTVRTMIPNQKEIDFSVTEGESRDLEGVDIIEEFKIKLPDSLPQSTAVDVKFNQDKYQLLHMRFEIESCNWSQDYQMRRKANLTEEDIIMMTGIALESAVS